MAGCTEAGLTVVCTKQQEMGATTAFSIPGRDQAEAVPGKAMLLSTGAPGHRT